MRRAMGRGLRGLMDGRFEGVCRLYVLEQNFGHPRILGLMLVSILIIGLIHTERLGNVLLKIRKRMKMGRGQSLLPNCLIYIR